jgi:hypothetical protein
MVSTRKRTAVRAAIVVALAAGTAIATLPGHGRARTDGRYGCDAVWTGPHSGSWGEAANWAARRVPGADDRACVPRGRTVLITRGDWRAASLELGGRLEVTHGSLRLADAHATSELGGLVMSHSRVSVAGVLEIADEFYWGPGARLAGGHIDLGVASHTRLVGGDGAALPRPATGSGRGKATASPPPCGPYSPLASRACGTRDRAALADVRATWSRFADLVRSGAKARELAPWLLPGRWDADGGGGGTTDLLEVARVARRIARPGPLNHLIVVGDRAYAVPGAKGHVELQRAGDRWLIAGL